MPPRFEQTNKNADLLIDVERKRRTTVPDGGLNIGSTSRAPLQAVLASPRRPLSRQSSLGVLLVFGGHNQQRHGALAGRRHLAGRQRPGDRGRERTPGGVRQELEQGSRARRLIGDLFLGAEAAAIRPFRSGASVTARCSTVRVGEGSVLSQRDSDAGRLASQRRKTPVQARA